MNDQSANFIYYALWLILPISALVARRIPMKDSLKMALAWVAIFGILFELVVAWQQAFGVGAGLRGFFGG
jgi:aspartyl protease family protein